jgi:signal transduction histidine kinase
MPSTQTRAGVFGFVGRRLALLNMAVVTVLIVLVGVGMVAFARYTLIEQADQALKDQAAIAEADWATSLATGAPLPVRDIPQENGDDNHHDDEESEAHELLESGDAIALGFDANGTLVANPRGLRMRELPDSEGVSAALAGEDRFRTIQVEDGEDVSVYTAPIEVNDQVVGVVQVLRSRSSLNSAIRTIELAALIAAAIGAAAALPAGLFLANRAMRPIDRAFRRQQAFIADASHELRTPLAVVRANTELVRRMPDAPPVERDEELAGILGEVDRMARLVDDLLVLARADAGQLPLEMEVCDLSAVVRAAALPMEALAVESGHSLAVGAPGELLVRGDEDRLTQVIRILIDNAIAFTPAGGSITVTSAAGDGRAIVTVTDTGVGMSEDEQRRIFDRFYRGERSRSRATGGIGLGLPIAHAIISAHDGEITIDSAAGQGTTVRVSLPRLSM